MKLWTYIYQAIVLEKYCPQVCILPGNRKCNCRNWYKRSYEIMCSSLTGDWWRICAIGIKGRMKLDMLLISILISGGYWYSYSEKSTKCQVSLDRNWWWFGFGFVLFVFLAVAEGWIAESLVSGLPVSVYSSYVAGDYFCASIWEKSGPVLIVFADLKCN